MAGLIFLDQMLELNIILWRKMSEEIKNFFSTYTDFVTKVTSDPSIDLIRLKIVLMTLKVVHQLRLRAY